MTAANLKKLINARNEAIRTLKEDDVGWKFIGQGQSATLTGVPMRDLADDGEDADRVREWEEREGTTLDKTGLFVREKAKGEKPAKEEEASASTSGSS